MGATLALQSAQKRMTGLDVAKTSVGARALLAEERKRKRRRKRRKKKKRRRRRPAITVRAYQAPTSVQREILKTAPKAYRAPLSVQREIAKEAARKKITVPGYQAPPSVQREIAKETAPLPAFAETTPARTAPPSGGGGGGWGGGAPRGRAPSAPQYAADPEPSLPLDPVFADEEKPFPWGIALLGGAVLLLVVMR
jgi:hypothetical protein